MNAEANRLMAEIERKTAESHETVRKLQRSLHAQSVIPDLFSQGSVVLCGRKSYCRGVNGRQLPVCMWYEVQATRELKHQLTVDEFIQLNTEEFTEQEINFMRKNWRMEK